MKVEINNELYTVSWRHNNNIGLVNQSGKPIKSSTECIITISGGGVLTGRSVLHDKDKNYNKKEGKKKSFDRAVSSITSRAIRTALWEKYWSISNPIPIIMAVSEDQLSMLRTLAIVEHDGVDTFYIVNKIRFKTKLIENDKS